MKTSICHAGIVLLATVVWLTGCEQSPKPAETSLAAITKYSKTSHIEGSVSTGRSLIKSGKLEVNDVQGKKLLQAPVENGHFQLEIPAGTTLPLELTVATGMFPEKLVAAVIYENVTRYDVDPSTTAIAKAAKALGGYNRANLVRAAEGTTQLPEGNKTSAGWKGDPTKQYGGWH